MSAQAYSSGLSARTGFGQLLHAEWTKLRTVRSWVVTVIVAALLMVAFSWLAANGNHASICEVNDAGPGAQAQAGTESCHGEPALPVGPGGEAVVDTYYFVHQPLTGDGSITTRVTSLTGVISTAGNSVRAGSNPFDTQRSGLVPWAKAGLLLTPSLKQGSAYAAVMTTGSHGVRMQSDYTSDTAGLPGAVTASSPRWLRLTRSGDTITGSDSRDGVHWTTITATHLAGLPASVQVGLFVTSPTAAGSNYGSTEPSYATAAFDDVAVRGGTARTWSATGVGQGPDYETMAAGTSRASAGGYTISSSGDIAPAVNGAGSPGAPAATGLLGAFASLIAVVILGALFMTSEYRRGLIRTTLTATPHRGRVLAAKAIVLAVATFLAALPAAIVSTAVSRHLLSTNGNALYPLSHLTEARLDVGTAVLVALTAVIALAVATIVRRGAVAVIAVVAVTALPLFLALTVAGSTGTWLLRLTPAAGFGMQQELPRYAQVAASYTATNGYFPFGPWGGLAALYGWTIITLVAARWVLRRRDA